MTMFFICLLFIRETYAYAQPKPRAHVFPVQLWPGDEIEWCARITSAEISVTYTLENPLLKQPDQIFLKQSFAAVSKMIVHNNIYKTMKNGRVVEERDRGGAYRVNVEHSVCQFVTITNKFLISHQTNQNQPIITAEQFPFRGQPSDIRHIYVYGADHPFLNVNQVAVQPYSKKNLRPRSRRYRDYVLNRADNDPLDIGGVVEITLGELPDDARFQMAFYSSELPWQIPNFHHQSTPRTVYLSIAHNMKQEYMIADFTVDGIFSSKLENNTKGAKYIDHLRKTGLTKFTSMTITITFEESTIGVAYSDPTSEFSEKFSVPFTGRPSYVEHLVVDGLTQGLIKVVKRGKQILPNHLNIDDL